MLTGESRFHIGTPLGIEHWPLMTGSKRVDHWTSGAVCLLPLWRVTVVAQWAKAPGIHCYVAGSIPAVTPKYCTKEIEKCSLEHGKKKREKTLEGP